MPRHCVLIETLWNVKKIKEMDRYYAELVLIETLWNVKTGTVTEQRCSVNVLIETLWNVKTKAEQKLIEESGINDKIKAELSEAKIKGVDKIKPDKMTLRNSLSIMDI